MALSNYRGPALLAVAATAWVAQSAAQSAGSAGGAPSSISSDSELATVIVTATRRSETVENVPGQVTALSSNDLTQMNASNFADFAAFVPGLSYANTGPASNLIVIRGVTTGTKLSSAIGIYLDDEPLGASTSFGLGYQSLNINVFDINRDEVLNGRQGTPYRA